MIPSYYKSSSKDFTLIQGDCVETLSKFKFGFDMVFADPPYFLSGGGISYQSGKVVCVDKGDWDKPVTSEELDAFNLRWLTAVREHMKDNATIWISGTHPLHRAHAEPRHRARRHRERLEPSAG